MKYTEINKKFTEVVADHLARGYVFNTSTMNGSQGEIARVDLTKGNEIITIYLNRFRFWKGDDDLSGVELVVAHPSANDQLIPNDHQAYRTLWLSRVEIISVERFFQVGRDDNWFVTEEEAVAASQKMYARYERKSPVYGGVTTYFNDPKALKLAKQYLIRRQISKRVNMSNLSVKKFAEKNGSVQYYVVYNGHSYRMR